MEDKMDKSLLFLGFLWIVYLGLIPLYIKKQKELGSVQAVSYKLTLSGIFCAIGLLGVIRQGGNIFCILIFTGLIFSLIGDYFLVFIKADEKKFISGIFFFGMTQICYISAMIYLSSISYLEIIIAGILAIGVILVKFIKKTNMGKTLIPLIIYISLVAFMAVKATSLLFSVNPPVNKQWLLTGGALLFLVSDMMLGTWRFLNQKKVLYNMVSICYFLGQLMIATVLYFQ